MFEQFSLLFNQRVPNMTVAFVLVTIIGFAWMLWQSPSHLRTKVFDVCLGAILAGIIVGRAVHVAIHWEFFSERTHLIWRLSQEGGLNWHALTLTALITGTVIARWRGVSVQWLLKTSAILVPLIALTSWYGCATVGCAYGEAVERMSAYPDWMTWIAPDIYRLEMPRFATQLWGMVASLILLVIALLLHVTNWLKNTRFWLMLLIIALVSLGIGFFRGDTTLMFSGMRFDQWFDIGIAVFSVGMMCISWVMNRHQAI